MKIEEIVVAIVDDDDSVRRALQRMVLSLSLHPVAFQSGEEFITSFDRWNPDCILLDLHMPGFKGLDVLQELASRGRHVPAIVITGFDQPGLREKCIAAGAAAYLVKPLESSEVADAISSTTGAWRAIR